MTERDRWGLGGPVRSCRLQHTWYSRNCSADACETQERGDVDILEFDTDGSLARHWHRNPDASEWTTTYESDGAGRRVESRTEDTGGIIGLQRCEYDSAGRLVRLIARDKDGVDRVTESWNYDPMGRKTRTLYVDVAGQSPNTTYGWAVEGTDAIYSAPGAASLTTLYNEREQPAQILFQDIAGRMLSRVEFVYDEAGRLIEEAQTRAEEALPAELLAQMKPEQLGAVRALFGVGKPTRRLHRYDLQGRRCETRSQLPPLGSDRKTTIYNNHGDPIEEHSESESREYSIDDDGRLSDRPIQETASSSEARFEYDYDAHGNWVKKMVKGAATGQDFTIASIEERTLTYYDEVPRS